MDCALAYGNEKEVGDALHQCFSAGVVEREEMFVTSKLWGSFHARDDVLKGCLQSLADLQLNYLDLYWPVTVKTGYNNLMTPDDAKLGYCAERIAACWKGMEDLVASGLVKAIGVANFSITKMECLLKTANIVPAVNQVECHPYLQQPKLVQYCKCKGIIVTSLWRSGKALST